MANHAERRLSQDTRQLLKNRSRLALDPEKHLEFVLSSKLCRKHIKEDLTRYKEERLRQAFEDRSSINRARKEMKEGRTVMAHL